MPLRLKINSESTEYLGHGGESVVSKDPDDESMVHAVEYESLPKKDALTFYYAHQVMSILFPHNFPRWLAAEPRGSVRERITIASDKAPIKFNFRPVYNFLHFLQLQTRTASPFTLEDTQNNYVVSEGGEKYYVDKVIITRKIDEKDCEAIKKYMATHKMYDKHSGEVRDYTLREVNKVQNYLKRIQHLQGEQI